MKLYKIIEKTGERWLQAELCRHKAQLLLRRGHSEAAEEFYCKALSIAREQEAKLWELRTAVSLARLWRDHGRPAEAYDLLAPVYGWFTEGFEISDLLDRTLPTFFIKPLKRPDIDRYDGHVIQRFSVEYMSR